MATWPSASKASTANLDSGTDSPASARADIKTNVDNVNEIIDMFNIASPTNNQILKYNSSNSRFELAADAGGISDVLEDTTPQLGGNLDVNGFNITSSSNGNIEIIADGTGSIGIGSGYQDTTINGNTLTLSTGMGGKIVLLSYYTIEAGNIEINGSISTPTDTDLSLSPSGTGKITIGSEINGLGNTISNVNLKDYKETNYALSYASTITPNVANGNVQTVTLTGNVTFNAFASPEAGQSLTLIVKQDATGSRTLTSSMKFAGGTKTLTTAANSTDIISVFYDGTTYWASLGKDFK
jgi:hypothetical protein